MNVRSDLMMAYHMGYDDALAKRMPDATKAGVLDSFNCTNSERTSDELGRGTWSDFDMRMAYHIGYDDAMARR